MNRFPRTLVYSELSSSGPDDVALVQSEGRSMRIYHSLRLQPEQLKAISDMWDTWLRARHALNPLLFAAQATLLQLPDASAVPTAAAGALADVAAGCGTAAAAAAAALARDAADCQLLGMSAAATARAVRAVAELQHMMAADKEAFGGFVARTALPSSVIVPWQVPPLTTAVHSHACEPLKPPLRPGRSHAREKG